MVKKKIVDFGENLIYLPDKYNIFKEADIGSMEAD